MKLIANWRQAPKMISVWCTAVNGALAAYLTYQPEAALRVAPFMAFVAALGFVGRFIDQGLEKS